MDGHQANPRQEGWKNVIGSVSDCELDWLRADLQHIEPGMPIIGFIHIPLVSTFTERRGEHPLSAPWWEVVNYDAVIDVFAEHNTKLILQGHLHENERIHYRGIDFITSGAVCGSWWRDVLNFDGSPRGYQIVSVVEDEVTSLYKSTGFPLNHQLRIEAPEVDKPKARRYRLGSMCSMAQRRRGWNTPSTRGSGNRWPSARPTLPIQRDPVLTTGKQLSARKTCHAGPTC